MRFLHAHISLNIFERHHQLKAAHKKKEWKIYSVAGVAGAASVQCPSNFSGSGSGAATDHSVGENHRRSFRSRHYINIPTRNLEARIILYRHWSILNLQKCTPMAPFASLHFPSFRLSITFKLDIYH